MRNTSTTVRLHPKRRGGPQHETPTADAVGIEGKSCSIPLAHASGWRLFAALHMHETSSELVGREKDVESQPKACLAGKNGATSPQGSSLSAVKQLATGEEITGRTVAK